MIKINKKVRNKIGEKINKIKNKKDLHFEKVLNIQQKNKGKYKIVKSMKVLCIGNEKLWFKNKSVFLTIKPGKEKWVEYFLAYFDKKGNAIFYWKDVSPNGYEVEFYKVSKKIFLKNTKKIIKK